MSYSWTLGHDHYGRTPPKARRVTHEGLCKAGVEGSSPFVSTAIF
jgi:hypothetical protein